MQVEHGQMENLMVIGNLGFSKAAAALSALLHRNIELCVPEARMAKFCQMMQFISDADSLQTVIYLKVEGDAPGKIALFLPLQSAEFIAQTLFASTDQVNLFDDGLAQSALKEVGNIVVSSWVSALADFSGINLTVSAPALAMDIAGAILDAILVDEGVLDDEVLLLSTVLSGSSLVRGQFVFFPGSGSLGKLLGALSA